MPSPPFRFLFCAALGHRPKYAGPRLMHVICGLTDVGGLLGLAVVPPARGHNINSVVNCMSAVGVAWASILSMPYAMLAPVLPRDKVGVLMGMFNLFIVLPQMVASSLLGFLLKHFFNSERRPARWSSAVCAWDWPLY